jgi:hypothetical protein
MKTLLEKLSIAMRRATVALLLVALGIFGLAVGLALLGLRPPAERYAHVATEITILCVYVFGLFAVTSLMAAAARRLAGDSNRPGLRPGKA